MEYAVVDLETTGGNPLKNRIIEIGIVITDGVQIIDSYSSLVYPEIPIPSFISRLTGITNTEVENAPKFYEVAKTVLRFIENRTFVAHNVHFDFGFLFHEFKSLGYHLSLEKLCTVRLGRKYLPGLSSYKLGNLCSELNIPIEKAHRALDDATATASLFHVIHSKISLEEPKNYLLLQQKIKELPEKAGVYYLLDSSDTILYIGKSINIKKRIQSHLKNYNTRKGLAILSSIARIDTELTGSDTMAILYENMAIKTHLPLYNTKQRRKRYAYGLSYETLSQYHTLKIVKRSIELPVIQEFSTRKQANSYLEKILDSLELCAAINLTGQRPTSACFRHQLKQCSGACVGTITPAEYNRTLEHWVSRQERSKTQSLLCVGPGRKASEYAFVWVNKSIVRAFGYFSASRKRISTEEILAMSESFEPSKDYNLALTPLFKDPEFRLYPFEEGTIVSL